MQVEITVRDGRAGHEAESDGKGKILGKAQAADFLDEGDPVTLPDGTKGIVIGSEELMPRPGIRSRCPPYRRLDASCP